MGNLPTSNTSNQLTTTSQTRVLEARNKDFKELISYICALLGTPKDKQPSSLELVLIINYFKTYLQENTIEDVKEAFDLAIQKRFEVNLELYGGTLSMKFISEVLMAFKAYKNDLLKKLAPKEEGMNNIERLKVITSFLSPELKEEIKQIGEVKQSRPDLPKLPYHDIHQRWLRQFDELKVKWGIGHHYIRRYGNWQKKRLKERLAKDDKPYKERTTEEIDLSGGISAKDYFAKKAEQFQMAKERNKDKI